MKDIVKNFFKENFDEICFNGSMDDIDMMINFLDYYYFLYGEGHENYDEHINFYTFVNNVFCRDDIKETSLIYIVKRLRDLDFILDFKYIFRDIAVSGKIDVLNYMLENIIQDHTFIYNTTACSNNPKTKEALRIYEEKLLSKQNI